MINIFVNPEEHRPRAGWRLVLQFLVMSILSGGLYLILYVIGGASGRMWSTISLAAGAVASILIAARWFDRRSLKNYGLIMDKASLRDGFTGFCLGAAAMAFIFGIEYAGNMLKVTGFGWQQSLPDESFGAWLALYFLFMILVGFYEELFSRGYQIINLSEGLNISQLNRMQAVAGSVAISALFFSLLHATNPGASWLSTLNVVLAGGMLAFPFIITGRLSFSIGLHIGWNFFQGGVFGFPVSGLAAHSSLIQINQQGMPLITGGSFGPEAGLTGLAGMLLIVVATAWYLKRRRGELKIHPGLGLYSRQSGDNLPE